MKKNCIIIVVLLYCNIIQAQIKYPYTRTVDSSDTWHGITIKDPYRWLENLKDPEVDKWFKDQSALTDYELSKMPLVDDLYKEMVALDSISEDQINKIREVGNTLFYFKIIPSESKAQLYRREGEHGKEILVASPNLWGKDFELVDYEIDPYKKYLAITAAAKGNERSFVKFYEIEKFKYLKDTIPGYFSGFHYTSGEVLYQVRPTWDVHTSVPEKEKQFKKHILGTPVEKDKVYLLFQTNPELYNLENTSQLWPWWPGVDFEYEILDIGSVSPYREIMARKINTTDKWEKVVTLDYKVTNYYCKKDKAFLLTNSSSPNGSLVMVDMSSDKLDDVFREIVPAIDLPLKIAAKTKNFLVLEYEENGVKMYHKIVNLNTGVVSPFPYPENTNLTHVAPFSEDNDKIHIIRNGWTIASTYSYADLSQPSLPEKKLSFRKEFNYPFTENITSKEVSVKGHDGVQIPVSIVYKKDLELNSKNTVLVYGYGAYGISTTAFYSPFLLNLVDKGVVFVVAHVRGGGEKGADWHMAGFKQTKPNTWKDLNSTAQWLIDNEYTSPSHLACMGGSAGGILIGRAITERSDLWACANPTVGCLTMVRQEFTPNGPINTPEFGSVKNINEFFALMEMDALLHVQEGVKYPAMLISTGWNDPRVISWQPAKFAAAAQKANASEKPVLLQVDYETGHGGSVDKFDNFKKAAKSMAFILFHSGYQKQIKL